MQIGSGQSALSLALLKALGSHTEAPAAAAEATAAKTAPAKAETVRTETVRTPAAPPAHAAAGLDGGTLPPRGSFVDLRV